MKIQNRWNYLFLRPLSYQCISLLDYHYLTLSQTYMYVNIRQCLPEPLVLPNYMYRYVNIKNYANDSSICYPNLSPLAHQYISLLFYAYLSPLYHQYSMPTWALCLINIYHCYSMPTWAFCLIGLSSLMMGASEFFLLAMVRVSRWTMSEMSSRVFPFLSSSSLLTADTFSSSSWVWRYPVTPFLFSTASCK